MESKAVGLGGNLIPSIIISARRAFPVSKPAKIGRAFPLSRFAPEFVATAAGSHWRQGRRTIVRRQLLWAKSCWAQLVDGTPRRRPRG